jgi:hypothetical protein
MKLCVFSACVFLIAVSVSDPGTDDLLRYDDGVADWFTFIGGYRGTWFHLDDFYPDIDASKFVVNYAEIWFFHVYSSPWDTSQFIGEITDGTPYAPGTVLVSATGTAAHLAPSYIYPAAPCTTGTDFTVTEVTTAFSANGSPSIASDISPAGPQRSFTVTTPGTINIWQYDFLVRVNGSPTPPVELERSTWASLKAVFDIH